MAVKTPTLLYDNEDSLKATTVTVTSAYGNKLQASNYSKNVTNIDASERTKTISITGNDKNNSIVGGNGKDTLDGGKGDDTLTGGAGADVFVYSGGNDVITDYSANEDTIKISSGSISGYSVSGDDVILTVGTGSLKIEGGKNDAITIKDSKNKISVYQDGVIYNNAKIEKATAVTISSNYEDETFLADSLNVTIDATNLTSDIEIIGNKKNNKLYGGSGNDTLNGGAGNDTLNGGGGEDIFIYEAGNDVITDYTENEDTILLSAGVEIVSYSVSGKDLVLKTNNKGSIKVKNAKTQAVKISDGENFVTYQNGLLYDGEDTSNTESVSITSIYGKEFNASSLSVENIDASTKNAAIKITGNDNDNKIVGTKKNDTINGGAGDDTINGSAGNDILTGGEGADVFIYADGDGRDTITDYGAGDVISLAGDYDIDYVYKTVKGGGGNSTLKIGKGSITIKDSANKSVTLIGANGEASIANNKSFFAVKDVPDIDAVYVTVPAETVTVGGGETVTVTLPAETVNVTLPPVTLPAETVNVTLPAETVKVYETVTVHDTVTIPPETLPPVTLPAETVTVYSSGESIKGTSAAETLYGTAGNDTVSLGGGKDVYIYSGGFDVIQDYTAGDDKISIGTESVSGGVILGSDVLFAVGDGMLKLVGAKDKKVTIISGGNETEYVNGVIDEEVTIPAGRTVTLSPDYSGSVGLSSYNKTLTSDFYTNIDASKVTNKSLYIYGDDEDNIIYSGQYANSIYAGKGNDTIYCGNGNDTIFYYEYDEEETVYNYKSGDVIYLQNNKTQFENFSLSGDDVIINTTDGGKITLKDAKSQNIYVNDYSYGGSYRGTIYNGTFGINISISGTSATLGAEYSNLANNSNTFKLDWYSNGLKNVDASAVKKTLAIYGNDKVNVIHAGKSGGSIVAGAGNDTIYCGNGNDSIYYSTGDGNETIYNYKSGDVIYFNTYTNTQHFKSFSLSGDDVIINTTEGSRITLKDVKKQNIYIYDHNSYKNATYSGTFGNISVSGLSATLDSDYTGTFNSTWYSNNFKNIDASAVENSIIIYGNSEANVIRAGDGDTDIYAGAGDDTIYCGEGYDIIRFYKNDGNETVYNIGDNDQVSLSSCTVQNISVSGSDVIVNTSSDETITLKQAKDKNVLINGQIWQSYTANTSARVIEDDIWFLEDDNNFVGGDIDSITEQKFAVTQIQTEPENIFAQDKTFVAYNTGEQK